MSTTVTDFFSIKLDVFFIRVNRSHFNFDDPPKNKKLFCFSFYVFRPCSRSLCHYRASSGFGCINFCLMWLK